MPDLEDRTPFISGNTASRWHLRAMEFNRRPLVHRQLIILGLLAAFAILVWLLTFHRDSDGPRFLGGGSSDKAHWDVQTDLPPPADAHHSVGHSHVATKTAVAFPSSFPVEETSNDGGEMTFALIMWGYDSAAEGAVLLKSILMYTSGPIHLHIICDELAQTYIEKRVRLIKRPRYAVNIRFYRPTWQQMRDRIDREGTIGTVHSAGTPGLMKLFIHEILPSSVKKVVFVDTDAFFITDPYLLWTHFTHVLPPSTVISMPTHPEMLAPQWFDANKICSCVMLMDLEALRDLRLMDSTFYRQRNLATYAPPAFRALFGEPDAQTGKYEEIALGDQTYWWAIILYMNSHSGGENLQPTMFQHLHYDWEVSSCLLDMYITNLEQGKDDADDADEVTHQLHTWQTPHEGEAIMPKLVHFNCLPADRYFDWPGWDAPVDDHTAGTDGLARRWGTAVKYHLGYKWLWLNRGSDYGSLEAAKHADQAAHSSIHKIPSPVVAIDTVSDVKFADELLV